MMNPFQFAGIALLAVVLVLPLACTKEEHESTPIPAPTWVNPDLLWSPQKLATELQNPTAPFVLVDVRDSKTTKYDLGHIQGAVSLSWKGTMGSPYMLPVSTIEANLSAAGITPTTKLVIYSEVDPPCN